MSILLNIVCIAVLLIMAFYYQIPAKLIRHLGLNTLIRPNAKIVMTGDALISDKWKELLKRNDILSIGNRGGNVDYISGRLNYILKINPEVCIITANGFDVYCGAEPNIVFKKYKTIIDTIKDKKITPVIQLALIAIPEKFEMKEFVVNVMTLNNLLKEYCRNNDIKYLDINPMLTENLHYLPKYSYRHGVSPNDKGYKIWANKLLEVLSKA